MPQPNYIRWFNTLCIEDVPLVGGKNASLGEMISTLTKDRISVPDGFATTADAYRDFLHHNKLDQKIAMLLKGKRKDIHALEKAGREIRSLILHGCFSEQFVKTLRKSYQELCRKVRQKNVDVAVRSSATAEDLPSASFAGQQDTYLHISGERALLQACLRCYASLFTDRAISYREAKGFDHLEVALSIGVQKMVRSDVGGSGVLFTLDMETGFRDVVVINAAWGLGENVVQGTVTPDEYTVFKPLLNEKNCVPILTKNLGDKEKKMIYGAKGIKNVPTALKDRGHFVLSDEEILKLARWGVAIEKHYGRPMDIEWAKDGKDQHLYIVQARPETVQSQRPADNFKTYTLKEKGKQLCKGLAIGEAIVSGKVQVIKKVSSIKEFQAGNILVTEMTAPDWVPIMQKASAIITDHGGRTSHAAIVSRELGIPAIVGTNVATKLLKNKQEVTVSCAEGDAGFIYEGRVPFSSQEIKLEKMPPFRCRS